MLQCLFIRKLLLPFSEDMFSWFYMFLVVLCSRHLIKALQFALGWAILFIGAVIIGVRLHLTGFTEVSIIVPVCGFSFAHRSLCFSDSSPFTGLALDIILLSMKQGASCRVGERVVLALSAFGVPMDLVGVGEILRQGVAMVIGVTTWVTMGRCPHCIQVTLVSGHD